MYRFRERLKRELPVWVERGLIDSAQRDAIAASYSLDALNAPTPLGASRILLMLGFLLVGAAVVSFVAAHWQGMTAAARCSLLLAAMFGAYGAGYAFALRPAHRTLGEGLIFLGALIYGANLALFGQIFHLHGDMAALLYAWGAGTLLLAFARPSTALALLAALTLTVGYSSAVLDWAPGSVALPLPQTPWLGFAAFVLLAQRMRSETVRRAAFVLTAYGLTLEYARAFHSGGNPSVPEVALPIFMLIVCAVWLYAPGLRAVALAAATLAAYVHSFWWVASSSFASASRSYPLAHVLRFWSFDLLALAFAIGVVRYLRRPGDVSERREGAALATLAAVVSFAAAVPLPVSAQTALVNLALTAPVAYAIDYGISRGSRLAFLSGVVFAAIVIVTRFLEYDSNLLVKSGAFALAGAIAIVAASWFERRLAGTLHA